MPSLSVRRAEALRDAAELRLENRTLRGALRKAARENRRGRHECLLSLARTSRLRAEPVPSPWSDLRWQRPGAALDGLLPAGPD